MRVEEIRKGIIMINLRASWKIARGIVLLYELTASYHQN